MAIAMRALFGFVGCAPAYSVAIGNRIAQAYKKCRISPVNFTKPQVKHASAPCRCLAPKL